MDARPKREQHGLLRGEKVKIVSGAKTYTDIKNLSFSPQADVTGLTCPINEFSVDIVTTDMNAPSPYAELRDDLNNLWAKYWITEQSNITGNLLRIRASSLLWPLDRVTLPAVMYEDAAVMDVLDDIFAAVSGQYDLDTSFATIFIDGFCPEQTARERLQWVCFVTGGYINTCFTDVVELLPVPSTAELIPANVTFWRPEVTNGQAVASVRAKVYSFTEGTPQNTDKWVTDGTTTWIVTEQWVAVNNPSTGQLSPSSVVSVEDVTIVNSTNINGILGRMTGYYFNPREVSLDIINNATYSPGQKVQVYSSSDSVVEGYIDTASFSFGLQARSRLHVSSVDPADILAAGLTIIYWWAMKKIEEQYYDLPVGYQYEFDNPYFDMTFQSPLQRFIIIPFNEKATGVVQAGGTTDNQYCDTALKFSYDPCILEIFYVDSAELNGEGVLVIS